MKTLLCGFNSWRLIVLGAGVLSGCAYRLPAHNFPSKQRLLIAGRSPERYMVSVQAYEIAEFPVAADGRVTIDVPILPRACGVYLFDRIRINKGVQPFTTKAIHLMDGRRVVARLSLADIAKLPPDTSGYHVLKLKR